MSAVGNRYAISRCSSSAPSSTAIRIAVVRKTAPRDMVIGFQEIMRGVYVVRLRMHSDHKAFGQSMTAAIQAPQPKGWNHLGPITSLPVSSPTERTNKKARASLNPLATPPLHHIHRAAPAPTERSLTPGFGSPACAHCDPR